MREKIFIVEDTFQITGRGIVVAGKLQSDSPVFRMRSKVILIRPDGKESETEISGIEIIKPLDYEKFDRRNIGVMLKDITKKEEVPIGTEVFLDKY